MTDFIKTALLFLGSALALIGAIGFVSPTAAAIVTVILMLTAIVALLDRLVPGLGFVFVTMLFFNS